MRGVLLALFVLGAVSVCSSGAGLASVATSDAAGVERLAAGRCIEERRSPAPSPQKKASSCPRDPDGPGAPLAKGSVRFSHAKGSPELSVEVARTPAEIERGLMYRTSLASDQGMIFAWSDERIRRFWMKNTCVPLDMLFIAKDGTVVGLLEELPVLNEVPRSVKCEASYVLEVNAGWSRRHGIAPGMKASIQL